ncbi:hypothetical protein HER32_07535 [Hymenobacter sp. BT18]|uniref:hypothetical protein n=1 Tax=Hymenobacter sp. BT18 TaxID=2835648 RepID=UPI00143EC564|nr:hypothetical protein [Hymenobacter sp. BT18]QIX61040.1 hypothetical protein HER32_07535 [Hymenobacter sp. BT18]
MSTIDRNIIDWKVQDLINAGGQAINLDRFSVKMDKLPIVNGRMMTPVQFMNEVRTNLNTYTGTVFQPHPYAPANNAFLWANNPIGSILSIGIPMDRGSVIVSEYNTTVNDAYWTFTTIQDPYNYQHPVTGK